MSVPIPNTKSRRAEPCACQADAWAAEVRRRLLDHSGLDADQLAECTFDRFRSEGDPTRAEMLRAAIALVVDQVKGRTLTYTGGAGVGKTHLLAAIVGELVERGKQARLVKAIDWFDELGAAIDAAKAADRRYQPYDGPSPASVTDELIGIAYLAIDELPAVGGLSDFRGEHLDRLIDGRYAKKRPTVIATNHPLAELPVRVASRLRAGAVVECAGVPDWRDR